MCLIRVHVAVAAAALISAAERIKAAPEKH